MAPEDRSSQDLAGQGEQEARTHSPDSQAHRPGQTSSQLAESALANLRKQLAAQRAGSPSQRSSSPASGSQRSSSPQPRSSPNGTKNHTNSDTGAKKSRLEERLRASFTVGEVSEGTTPSASGRASPRPVSYTPASRHPLSPTSTPLPESPVVSPATLLSPPDSLNGSPEPAAPTPETSTGTNTETTAPETIPPDEHLPAASQASASADDSVQDNTLPDATATQFSSEESHGPDPEGGVASPPLEPPGPTETLNGDEQLPSEHADASLPLANTNDELRDTLKAKSTAPDADVESLQERLKLVERRFADVSASFKRLQAERSAVSDVFRELTPLEGTSDVAALRDFLSNMNMKTELAQDEIQRLNGKLTRQEERIEELRDTHRLESSSQSDQIERMRKQLAEGEALIAASQASTAQTEERSAQSNAQIQKLQSQLDRAKQSVAEEEEKRTKAITLLKTVRQKLSKAEKERDDAVRELNEGKGREKAAKEQEKSERLRLENEIQTVNAERERAVAGLRSQFDKELATKKDKMERELAEARGRMGDQVNSFKQSHSEELAAKNARISSLEASVNKLSKENQTYFEQTQVRQAEFESSQYHAESLQGQNTELNFQVRELQERIALLSEEVSEARDIQGLQPQGTQSSSEDLEKLLSATEANYEAKLTELRKKLNSIEKERTSSEADWSRKLKEKSRETDELKAIVQGSAKAREEKDAAAAGLQDEISRLRVTIRSHEQQHAELVAQLTQHRDLETSWRQRVEEAKNQTEALKKQVDESNGREAQLRAQNKSLRDELRKVQSSVALLEKQRNPGVGYWASRNERTDSRTSISSASDAPSESLTESPKLATQNGEEEVNLEYVRNVILQFLEHKEMRPNLVRVLSTILHFTPQETRRLVAKV